MSKHISILLAASALALSACGGGASETEHAHHEGEHAHHGGEHAEHGGEHAEHGGEHAEHGGEHAEHGEDHHHDFPAELNSFHDTLGPVWHSEPGEARGAQACAQIADFQQKAVAVQGMAVPEAAAADEAGWGADATGLTTAVEALASECNTEGAEAEVKLSAVHDAFHAIIERLGHE